MKIYLPIITVLVVSLSVNAQNANAIDSVVSSNAFINLPLQPHKKRVDIFFNCDRPKQPFYNIKVLDVKGGNSYQDLLNKMQEAARNEGFDGVIILGKSTTLTQDNSATTALVSGLAQGTAAAIAGKTNTDYNRYEPFFNSVNILSAIGIKYQSNMQYVDKIIKSAIIHYKDSTRTDTIKFTLNSDLENSNTTASNFYENEVMVFQVGDYFATHPMSENATKNYNDAEFSETLKVPNAYGNIKYKLMYTSDSFLYNIQIRIPTSDVSSSVKTCEMTYDLNKDKTINKRFVRAGRKADLIFTDSYQYDNEKRCIGFTRYDEKTKTTLLQVNYAYFTMNDLPRIN